MADTTTLEALIGEHELSGVDFEQVRKEGDYSDANVIRFVLDGKIYVVTEDPDDGYRSSMRDIEIVTEPPVANVFAPVKVLGRMAPDSDYEKNDYVELLDVANGQVVLEVGTSNTTDYYPSFVGNFYPDRLAVNSGK